MITSLKPYPAMKDSGVEWLGEVPEHWDVRRLRNAAEMRVSNVDKHVTEDEIPIRLCNYVDVYKHDHIDQRIGFMQATATPAEIERFRLEAGDVLITKDSETWNDIGVPALVTEPADDLILGYHLALLRSFANELSGGYLLRALQSKGLAYQFHVEAKGVTRYGLSHASIKSVWLPLPPLPEQAAIVRYLNHVDRRVRRLVRAKRKLIALLTEQKQAIIHRAVTRGLNPDVPMKDSGVEWLGEVPEHWEVRRIHQVTDPVRPVMYGIVLPGPHVDDGVWIVKGGSCEPGRLQPDRLSKTTREIESRYVRSRLVGNDIVFAIRGGVGAAEVVPDWLVGANLTQDAARIAAGTGVNPRWLLHAVRAPMFQSQIQSMIIGATVRGINIRDLKRAQLVRPPLPEQAAIVEYLDQTTADIDTAIARTNREIDLLNEYRTRLVADVVTGKVDVREAAAALPEVDPLATEVQTDDTLDTDAEADIDEMDLIPGEDEP
ncbi:restriction endonuclease subunit S [Desulfococcus sp.]|uniref:restriction endonuclease subunit S n=1 Tax=Desulfococcus sp. TaxID=2025834 RepID=UPI003593FD84